MQLDFLTVLINVTILVLLALPGYALKKFKMIKTESVAGLVTLLLYINQPFLTIKSFQAQSYVDGTLTKLGIVLLVSFVSHFAFFLIAKLFFKIKDDKEEDKKVSIFSVVFSNASFMGIPVVVALSPDNPMAVIYASIYILSFNMLTWTLGAYILTGRKEYIKLKKAFLNPPTIVLAISIPLFFLNIKLPLDVMRGVSFLGDMTIPLSMIIMGIRFADMKMLDIFKGLQVYKVALLKLVVMPFVILIILLPFTKDHLIYQVLFFVAAMPVAGSTVLFSEKLNSDTPTAVKNMLTSTFMCILTLPLLAIALNYILTFI